MGKRTDLDLIDQARTSLLSAFDEAEATGFSDWTTLVLMRRNDDASRLAWCLAHRAKPQRMPIPMYEWSIMARGMFELERLERRRRRTKAPQVTPEGRPPNAPLTSGTSGGLR